MCSTQDLGHRVAEMARSHCHRFIAVIYTETERELATLVLVETIDIKGAIATLFETITINKYNHHLT